MTWLVATASLFATILNVRRVRLCFAIWFVTNVAWVYYDLAHGLVARAPLDATYAGLAVWGWIAWGRRTDPARTSRRRGSNAPLRRCGASG